MRIFATLSFFVLALFATSCDTVSVENYDFQYNQASNSSAEEIIKLANDWRYSYPDITSFVDAESVNIKFPDGRGIKKLLPLDKFYIAAAPFEKTTHPCETHYPSSCDGEMKNQEFDYSVTDGNTEILSGKITTLKNGFFELWLPRNKTNLKLHVEKNGKKADQVVTTLPESKTCYTTLELQ